MCQARRGEESFFQNKTSRGLKYLRDFGKQDNAVAASAPPGVIEGSIAIVF